MARISGVDLPRDKRVEIGLTYIYGIGATRAKEILAKTGIDPDVRPGFSSIDVAVQLSGPETEERYQELVEAVERHCPVLDSLGNKVPVRATYATV